MLYKREILSHILAQCDNKEIIILTGARQTGKTTLLRQIEIEIQKNRPAFFLNLENLEFVKLLNDSPENLFKIFPLDKNSAKIFYINMRLKLWRKESVVMKIEALY
jgi:uncharacterized protein